MLSHLSGCIFYAFFSFSLHDFLNGQTLVKNSILEHFYSGKVYQIQELNSGLRFELPAGNLSNLNCALRKSS